MNVGAIIVTKGDQDLTPIAASIPDDWDLVIWDNSQEPNDLAVYGRYAAVARTDAELIYVQDDDCVVSDPQAIVRAWHEVDQAALEIRYGETGVVCNMPSEFRHNFYSDHALVGFGAAFHRDAPARAWSRWDNSGMPIGPEGLRQETEFFYRTCDIVFTALTPRVLVDVPVENLPWAYQWDRMYRQPELLAERVRMLDLVREIA